MIKVQIFRNNDGQVLSFIASGHADQPDWEVEFVDIELDMDEDFETEDFPMESEVEEELDLEDDLTANSEYDLICAAASAIMQTALMGLGGYVGLEGRLTYNIDEDGWLYCKLPEDLLPEERMRADAILETMVIGLKSIATDYHDKIMVEEEVE